ncbi:unnamed protein product [Oncorhynchus mykiss]|uniref:Claudin n=1 Tax=Oncorhynchus mykiss TaxID=8022 RepID=A0A060X8G1_ONCMY|nr:unnamed protein product [Oncorhynchus mykiss]
MGMDIIEMVEVVGIAMEVIGLILAVVVCALPTGIVTIIIQANVANTEVVLYGLWMSCVTQSTGKSQCEVFNSMWYLHHFLQPARAMILTAIILGVLGVMFSMVGAKCTNCIKDKTSQAKVDHYCWNTFPWCRNSYPHHCFLGSNIYHHRHFSP